MDDLSSDFFIRWQALKALWIHRSYWRLEKPRQMMRAFRDQHLTEIMPFLIVIGVLAGGIMFILLPGVLPEQAAGFTAVIWPIWVNTAAPMVCAQTMALLVAPTTALDLIQKHASGYFVTIHPAYGAPAGYPCISWIVALAAVCVITNYVLILFSILIGLGLAFMLSVGDVRATLDAVLFSAPPMEWLRSGLVSALLGTVCGLSVVLHAWPGTRLSNSTGDNTTHSHRLGLRVTLICSIMIAVAGIAINSVIGLFDRPPI